MVEGKIMAGREGMAEIFVKGQFLKKNTLNIIKNSK